MVVIHSSKLIYPRELYQRGIQRKRVELIARDFNEYTANEPKVSFRNGRYYVTDGQHTIEARILRNGGKDLPILCKVYSEHPACHQLYEEGRLTSWTNAEPNAILSAVTGGATSRTIAGRSLTTK